MSIETTNEFQLPSTPKDRKAIKDAAEEIIIQLIHKASADDQIKAITERMKEELEVPPKFLKKLAVTEFKDRQKGNEFERQVTENESFATAFETLFRIDNSVTSDEADSDED